MFKELCASGEQERANSLMRAQAGCEIQGKRRNKQRPPKCPCMDSLCLQFETQKGHFPDFD